jgi:hypothetical protein
LAVTARGQEIAQPLPPGLLTVIPANALASETFLGPMPITEITKDMANLEWTPHFAPKNQTVWERAQQVTFRRSIWCLEFAFKPLRMIEVDEPQPSGKMQRKRVWYLVYRVRNQMHDPNKDALSYVSGLQPEGAPDQWGHTVFRAEEYNFKTRRFLPHFVLHSFEFDKEYLDRIIPSAQRAIQEREEMGVKLHNSVEISRVPIELSDDREDRGVWGLAMWEDVDPRMDFFCIDVGGLTNAFRVELPAATDQPTEAAKPRFLRKTLQLNFWRPGDAILEHERELRYGVPIDADPAMQAQILQKYGLQQRLDHVWVYR